MLLYSAVDSLLDRSKRFTLFLPWQPVHSDTNWTFLGSILVMQPSRREYTSTAVYSHVLIYTDASTEASWRE